MAKKGIDLTTLPITNPYRLFYEFAVNNNEILTKASSAEQVAILKSEWFGIPYQKGNETAFVKEEEKNQLRYIMIKVDNEPVIEHKYKALKNRQHILNYPGINKVFKDERSIKDGSLSILMDAILHDPYLFDRVFKANNQHFPRLISNPLFSHYKSATINAMVDFTIQSAGDLLNILKNVSNAYDRNEFILLLLKKDQGFGRLSWNLADLYAVFKICPERKQAILQSILLSSPDMEDLFSLLERNIESVEKVDAHIFASIEKLYKEKLLDDITANIFLNSDSEHVLGITDTMIILNSAKLLEKYRDTLIKNVKVGEATAIYVKTLKKFKLLNDERVRFFLKDVSQCKIFSDAFNYLTRYEMLTKERVCLVLDNDNAISWKPCETCKANRMDVCSIYTRNSHKLSFEFEVFGCYL